MENNAKSMRNTSMKEDIYTIYQTAPSRALCELEICGITYPDKNYGITRKKSKITCIEYVESGEGEIHLPSGIFKPCAGDSYILMQGQDQHYFSNPKNPWKKLFINVSGQYIEGLCELYSISGCVVFKGLDTKRHFESIIQYASFEGCDKTGEILREINAIFYKMYLCRGKTAEANTTAHLARQYIDSHLYESFNMKKTAEFSGHSQSQTLRLFKKQYGLTPHAYYMEKKLEAAKKLLSGTSLSIKETAHLLGFSDEYYFSGVFRQKLGVCPSEYRKNLRK